MATPLRHIATEPANLNRKISNMDSKNDLLKPQQHNMRKSGSHLQTSDSDLSVDTNSLSQESQPEKHSNKPTSSGSSSTVKQHKDLKADWEIIEGLKDGQRCEEKPIKYEGHVMKRRKWPLKGWHKRFCVLDNGSLKYSKTAGEMVRGRIHGQVDLGLSVISTRLRGRRIDIDAEDCIYHFKVKSADKFSDWVGFLRHHRLYRQHQIAFGHVSSTSASPSDDVGPLSLSPVHSMSHVREGTPRAVRSPSFMGRTRVAAWLVESAVLEKFDKELGSTQESLFQLSNLAEQLNEAESSAYQVNPSDQVASSNAKRDRKRFILKRKKAKGSATDLTSLKSQPLDLNLSSYDGALSPSSISIREMISLSTSNPNLPTVSTDVPHASNHSLFHGSPIEKAVRQEFVSIAQDALKNLKSMVRTIQMERERLKQALEVETISMGNVMQSPRMATSLAHALQQNAELRSTLGKIRALTNVCESRLTSPEHVSQQQSVYENSSAMSMSEYFDADDDVRNDSSSEVSISEEEEEGSVTSEASETGTDSTPAQTTGLEDQRKVTTGRRTCLPAPKPESGDLNLWNLLRRNIGKDLSKIAMPVTLNEPLNTLQRLCEELEYSDLLDKAAETDDFHERMVLVAAFAVSAYSSSYYRAGHKPFNPLLGETYECIREDKGFRFIAEQVSHHPPVSVCYTESKNFIFWQDMRVKTTFWGKSMEVQPLGTVHLVFPKHHEHYRWNKVTTCIHNLFGGQNRQIDLYGEMMITCASIKTKLTFAKSSYWSNKRYEVYGSVFGRDGKVVHNLFGKWNEAIYCGSAASARCVWRIGAIPEENERYYGFTRFAMELNELQHELAAFLPPTDTRFRPDQRLLEEGNVQAAEAMKIQLEQAQRERRSQREADGSEHEPLWFRKMGSSDGKESWEYTGKYWEIRKSPGFINYHFPQLLW